MPVAYENNYFNNIVYVTFINQKCQILTLCICSHLGDLNPQAKPNNAGKKFHALNPRPRGKIISLVQEGVAKFMTASNHLFPLTRQMVNP